MGRRSKSSGEREEKKVEIDCTFVFTAISC
jgi:hypothetical protein